MLQIPVLWLFLKEIVPSVLKFKKCPLCLINVQILGTCHRFDWLLIHSILVRRRVSQGLIKNVIFLLRGIIYFCLVLWFEYRLKAFLLIWWGELIVCLLSNLHQLSIWLSSFDTTFHELVFLFIAKDLTHDLCLVLVANLLFSVITVKLVGRLMQTLCKWICLTRPNSSFFWRSLRLRFICSIFFYLIRSWMNSRLRNSKTWPARSPFKTKCLMYLTAPWYRWSLYKSRKQGRWICSTWCCSIW